MLVFLENFAYVLNEWSLAKWLDIEKKLDKFKASGEFFRAKRAILPHTDSCVGNKGQTYHCCLKNAEKIS